MKRAVIGGLRFSTLSVPTTPAAIMTLPTFLELLVLLKKSESVTNTDSVTLVPFVMLSRVKLLGRERDAVGLCLGVSPKKRSLSFIVRFELKSPSTALKLSPMNVVGFTFWTDTAKVVCVTTTDVSFSGMGMFSVTVSRASNSLQDNNDIEVLSQILRYDRYKMTNQCQYKQISIKH